MVVDGEVYNISHVLTTSHLSPGKFGGQLGVVIFAKPHKEQQP